MIVPLVLVAALAVVDGNPWVNGPPAPAPTQPAPFPQAPREPGAHVEELAIPAAAPDPKGAPLDDGIPSDALVPDERMSTSRTRAQLFAHGALDPASALVDVPGLWLRHEQAGDARMLARGLSDRDLDVTLDGVPLFDLGGLVPPLEQLTSASTALLTLHHGPHALSSSPKGGAGALAFDDIDAPIDLGESFGLRGVVGGGYGGADLEKGVFTAVQTGYGRGRIALDATLLDREDQRLGRGVLAAGEVPGGVLERSGGDDGAIGARADIVPARGMHLFTSWHSARTLLTPHPDECQGDDSNGRALDCTRTTERGLDLWLVGGDDAIALAGSEIVLHARAHIQHGIANEERSGTGINEDDRNFDDGVRAGALASADLKLPSVALGDVWTPRASIGANIYADRFSSSFFVRSTRRVDAEPPGNGTADPARARLADGDVDGFGAVNGELMLEGARTTLWLAGQAQEETHAGASVAGEVGVKTKIVDALYASATLVHLAHEDTLEGGVGYGISWLSADAVVYGTQRTALAGDTIGLGVAGEGTYVPDDELAYGFEARAQLRPGLTGLLAEATLAAVLVDDGALLHDTTPHADVPNPMGTVAIDYDPPLEIDNGNVKLGFGARARFLLPQSRLSPNEALDHGLCPELPSADQLAAGVAQQSPCTGAIGAFGLDLGAHVDFGAFRIDAMALNLLDQQGALRDEPIGWGGTSFRALLTIAL